MQTVHVGEFSLCRLITASIKKAQFTSFAKYLHNSACLSIFSRHPKGRTIWILRRGWGELYFIRHQFYFKPIHALEVFFPCNMHAFLSAHCTRISAFFRYKYAWLLACNHQSPSLKVKCFTPNSRYAQVRVGWCFCFNIKRTICCQRLAYTNG